MLSIQYYTAHGVDPFVKCRFVLISFLLTVLLTDRQSEHKCQLHRFRLVGCTLCCMKQWNQKVSFAIKHSIVSYSHGGLIKKKTLQKNVPAKCNVNSQCICWISRYTHSSAVPSVDPLLKLSGWFKMAELTPFPLSIPHLPFPCRHPCCKLLIDSFLLSAHHRLII